MYGYVCSHGGYACVGNILTLCYRMAYLSNVERLYIASDNGIINIG